ncbi:MAG: hypothetical protein LUE65_08815 [Clostridiales bacterium]|nr:hypothetical protein [Clostridiales bacterium]
MKKYQAPLAQVLNFDNDYVVTAKDWNKPQGCAHPTGNGESYDYGTNSTSLDY